jgi:hypothetical protein
LNRRTLSGPGDALHGAENQLPANDNTLGRISGFVLGLLLSGDGSEVLWKPRYLPAVEIPLRSGLKAEPLGERFGAKVIC